MQWQPIGSPLGLGMNNWVLAVAVSSNYVYAGGLFGTAGGVTVNFIARHDGTQWSAMGSGVNSTVRALTASGDNLYLGGDFTTAGGKVSAHVARTALGNPPGYNQLVGKPLPGGTVQLSYMGNPATNYALDRTFNLAAPVGWVGQGTNTMGPSGVLLFTNTPLPGTNNFWRVRSVP